jgi:hypothetical protein
MKMPRCSARLEAAVAIATLCLVTTAAEAATPRWKLGPREIVRYRITNDKKAAKGESPVTMPEAIRLHRRCFKKNLSYALPVNSLQRLILSAALSVPNGRKVKGRLLQSAVYDGVKPLGLKIQSVGHAQIEDADGDLKKISGELTLSQANLRSPSYAVQSGRLTWTTLFDPKAGVVDSAQYSLEIIATSKASTTSMTYKYVGSGRLILIDKGERSPEEIKRNIAEAISRGASWLKGYVKGASGTPRMGKLALSMFALLRSGVEASDPVILAGFKKLATMELKQTYDVSLYIMALEARSVTRHPPEEGSTIPRFERGRPAKADAGRIATLAGWLLAGRNPGKGTWHYTPAGTAREGSSAPTPGSFDNSCTQFAVLALHVAHRVGVAIPVEVWGEIFEHFRLCQTKAQGAGRHDIERLDEKGRKRRGKRATVARRGGTSGRGGVEYRGWAYGSSGTAYGSMTNAGLSSLAIAADMLKGADKLSSKGRASYDRMVAEGLHWQAKNFSITENPKGNSQSWYYYYMYSLEKACELLAVERFDGRDWYLEGADHICALQETNGSWKKSNESDTGLALLFLNRATLRTTVNVIARRRSTGLARGDASDRSTVLVEKAGGLISLDQVARALAQAPRNEISKLKRWFDTGLADLDRSEHPVLIPSLAEIMRHGSLKSWARKHLRRITFDSKLKTADDFTTWHDRWQAIDAAPTEHAYERIELLRQTLSGDPNRVLRKAAMLTAVRLMAVELTGELAALLDEPRDEALARDCLSVLIGRAPKDRAEAEAWATEHGASALEAQQGRRRAARAARGDEGAAREVIAGGKRDLGELVKLSRDPKVGAQAASLLTKITGVKQDADKWRAWWQENHPKLDANGRLPSPLGS